MKQHLALARHAINTMGFTVSVDDGDPDGELTVENSTSVKEVIDACEGVDESHMFFFDKEGNQESWAFIVLGNDDGDEVCDYGESAWIDAFFGEDKF